MPGIDEHTESSPEISAPIISHIAGRIDFLNWLLLSGINKSRYFAEKLDKSRHIYTLYALLDGISLSYSEFKLVVDMFISTSNQVQFDLLASPAGIVSIGLETAFLVGFSMLASIIDGEKNPGYWEKKISSAWPYVRDILKASKNSYKGLRATLYAATVLGTGNILVLLVPCSLGLGVLGAITMVWHRSIFERRKEVIKLNTELINELLAIENFDTKDIKKYRDRIQSQSKEDQQLAFFLAGTNGVIYGLYLYMGLLSLAILPTVVLWPMALLCTVYTGIFILTRIHQEYERQVVLAKTRLECELVILGKQLRSEYFDYLHKHKDDDRALMQCQSLFDEFERKRIRMLKMTCRTYKGAILHGLGNALAAYSAISSALFLTGTILVLCSVGFPWPLLVAGISALLLCLIAFVGHSLYASWRENHHLHKRLEKRTFASIGSRDEASSSGLTISFTEQELFERNLFQDLSRDPSPQFFWQELFEVLRSLFSGFGKGQKSVDMTLPLQQINEQNQPYESPVMIVLALGSALLYAAVLGLRAFAKGFGKPPAGHSDLQGKLRHSQSFFLPKAEKPEEPEGPARRRTL